MQRKLIVTIPHWSNEIPGTHIRELKVDGAYTAKHVDLHTDLLFELPAADAIVKATVSRFIVDLNRARDDFGKRGVIIHTSWDEREVVEGPLPPAAIEERLHKYYDPFHAKIKDFLATNHPVLLIDGHSMAPVGEADAEDVGNLRPELMIGTNGFRTVPEPFAQEAQRLLEEKGFEVKIDVPYGTKGYIFNTYSRPPDIIGMEIEVNKKMYLDMETCSPLPEGVEKVKAALNYMAERMKTFEWE